MKKEMRMISKDGTNSEFPGYTSSKEEVEEEDEEEEEKEEGEEEKEESEKKGSKEASEMGSISESPSYAAFDNEAESDLESTTMSEPKCKEMKDTCRVWGCDRLVSRAKVIENQVMAALVPIAPEEGAPAVASPVRVLKLDTHSPSEADPSESSLPLVSVAPMVSPFLCLDDSKSDTEMSERHLSPTPHDAMLTRALTARKSVRPLSSHRLALRYTSHHLDRFTSGSSSGHSSSDHSSSRHSISSHSLSGHTPPDTTIADSSTPPKLFYPPLARTPRCSV
ncbi:hypothetical protein Tco_0266314 [Tanacetum coccineum]